MYGHSRLIISIFLLLFGVGILLLPNAALANHCNDRAKSGSKATEQTLAVAIQDPNDPTRTIHCIPLKASTIQANPIFGLLRTILQFMAGGIALAIVGGISYGAILYMTARANAQQVQKAEEVIRNSIIALILFIFTFLIVNFVIPGRILL